MQAGTQAIEPNRIRAAWQGRISGCVPGKPLEVLSFREGPSGVRQYLHDAGAAPLRDYIPPLDGARFTIDYTLLALMLVEEHGTGFQTDDVARAWLRLLPAGATWTAERAACRTLLDRMAEQFVNGEPAGFEPNECSDNEYNVWIGAQIRADLYGCVCPGRPTLAAELARRDASLSHRGDGVHAAHAAHAGDFSATVGEAVAAGWDTDCNGATVGGLCALSGAPMAARWTRPWQGRIGTRLAGHAERLLEDVARRTVEAARSIA